MTIAANTAASQRTGTVSIAGQTFTVTQAAGVCAYTVTPGTLSVSAAGLTSSFSISTAAGCSWSASGMPAWITISTATQTGPGLLSYTIAPTTTARSATLTIAGKSVVVNQSAPVGQPPRSRRRRPATSASSEAGSNTRHSSASGSRTVLEFRVILEMTRDPHHDPTT